MFRLLSWKLWIVGAAALALWGCGQEEPPASEPVIRPVRVEPVRYTGGKRIRTFSGTARAGLESSLSFRTGGSIKALPIKLGDRVRRGQVIARLDPKDFELQVQEAEASLNQAKAQARNASANYERIRGLYENNNVSINDLDAARADTDSANAQVVSIAKRLELAQSQLSYTELKAPVDGFIAEVKAEVNENIQGGQAIAVLNAGSRPETTFLVPEQLIGGVREGEKALVRFDAIAGETFEATITEVGVASGQVATTFPVTARLDKGNGNVRQGMVAEVSVTFGSAESAAKLYVKPKAVVEDRSGRFVYVADPAGQQAGLAVVRRREVETGELTNDGLEVLSGLTENELLVVAGIRFLEEGMTVKLPDGGGA